MTEPESGGWGRGAGGRPPKPDAVRGPFRQRSIDHYRVLSPLGEGGMGTVYLGFDTKLQREVALKVLLPGPYLTEDALTRFVDEARITAKVSEHPNLVSIYDAARSSEGEVYLAMEMIRGGQTLQSWIDGGRTRADPRPAAELLAQVCDGLQHVHDQGVVHRDLKPANILIKADGRAVLGDFGVAKTEGQRGSHTLTGTFMGTLAYASPEQATDAKRVTSKSDLYGIGAILFAVLTGRAPHVGPNAISIMISIVEGTPPAPRELCPEVPPELEAVCLKALARDPDARYGSASELAEALRAAAGRAGVPASETRPARVKPVGAKPVSGRVRAAPSRRRADAARSGSLLPIAILGAGALVVVSAVALSGRKPAPKADEVASAAPEPSRPQGAVKPTPTPTPTSTPTPTATPTSTPSETPSTSPTPSNDTSPRITVRSPTGAVVRLPLNLDLRFDRPIATLTLNGKAQALAEDRSRFVKRFDPGEVSGPLAIHIAATDERGNTTRTKLQLTVDRFPPKLVLRLTPRGKRVRLTGTVEDESDVVVRLGKREVVVVDGRLDASVSRRALRSGRLLTATDGAGRVSAIRLTARLRKVFDLDGWRAAPDAERWGEALWILTKLSGAWSVPGLNGRPSDRLRTAVFEHGPTGLPMLLIPGGLGSLGTAETELDREVAHARTFPDVTHPPAAIRGWLMAETPRHTEIEIPPFLLGLLEVREREWDRVRVRGLPALRRRGAFYPRGGLSWHAAKAWLSAAGDGLRLPSEAEWEFAYRAGTTTRYFWGDAAAPGRYVGGKEDRDAEPEVARRGSLRRNPLGLIDMAGNCWEWCEDDFLPGVGHGKRPRTHEPFVAALKARKRSPRRVAKGGSACDVLPMFRAAYRARMEAGDSGKVNGFRAARSLPLKRPRSLKRRGR